MKFICRFRPASLLLGRVAMLASCAVILALNTAPAAQLVATDGTSLGSFDTKSPGTVSNVAIFGMQAGEVLRGIDYRPADGQLYGIGSHNRLYLLIASTGQAVFLTNVNSTFGGAAFGTDFNPVTDRIRIVSDVELNARIHPDTGVVTPDNALNPPGSVVALAHDRTYTRVTDDTTPTTVYGIDSESGLLVRIGSVDGSPNSPAGGQITTVGSLGLGDRLSNAIGFDIATDGVAYATITGGNVCRLYTINLGTGAASSGAVIGDGTKAYHSVTSKITPPRFVTNTNDSGAGSLRQAILDSNASTTVNDIIKFNITGAGPHTITPATPLPQITDRVTIDARSEPSYDAATRVPVVVLDGTSVPSELGLDVQSGAAGSVVQGLRIIRFFIGLRVAEALNTVIRGNYFGTDGAADQAGDSHGLYIIGNVSGTLVGGRATGDRNLISGHSSNIWIVEATGVTVQGNFIGTNAAGTAAVDPARTAKGIRISDSSGVRIGGVSAGAGNLISGHALGVQVDASGVTLEGNLIGTNHDKSGGIGNDVGVLLDFAREGNVVGGLSEGAGNTISYNGTGLRIFASSDNLVQGNSISYNTNLGIEVTGFGGSIRGGGGVPAQRNWIGGSTAAAGNFIGHNNGPGVLVHPNVDARLNPIRFNTFVANSGLAIDLAPNAERGSTPNDLRDEDLGPNGLQNYPVLVSATEVPGAVAAEEVEGIRVEGRLNSTPNSSFVVDCYISQTAGARIQFHLGTLSVTTDAAGDAAFAPIFPLQFFSIFPPNSFEVFATATSGTADAPGETSELSGAVPIRQAGGLRFAQSAFEEDESTGNVTIAVERVNGTSGTLSVQYFTADGSAVQPDDYSAASGTLTFAPGQTSASFVVAVLDDATDEDNETIVLTLSNPSAGGTLETPSSAALTIIDNDVAPPTPSPSPSASPTPTATPTVLGNIATRLGVETGDNVLIGGFIITGTQPKKLIVRAIGPSSGLEGALADPLLEMYDGSGELFASNDNWEDAENRQEIIDSTIPPSHPLEAAFVASLPPGSYTAVVSGVGGGTGIGVVEAYDLDRGVDSKLANIATRGVVKTGENVMIGGLIILGETPQKVLVRAIGPSLPVDGRLANPTLDLVNGDGESLAFNDNWRDDQPADIEATTIPPPDDFESAIVATLQPGQYTAVVRGSGDGTGIALVEVYALD